jgi:predicted lipoprotein with Yx(FWY)xxD motif
MNRFKHVQLTVILCALLVFASTAVSTNAPAQAGARDTAAAMVKAAPIPILVNAKGLTLYLFTADKKNQSTCTGQCAKFWPPLLLGAGTKAPATIPGIHGAFALATQAGGSKQVTFNGSPLYTFVKDKKPGEMNGEGVGGVWWVATAAGSSGAVGATSAVKLATVQMLVSSAGKTLYLFTQDKKNQSTCTGKCATFWPPLLGGAAPAAVDGFSGKFGLTTAAGAKQVTYNGAPLYTFANDKKAGDTNGQGVGGVWWMVLAPAGANASLVKTAPASILVTAQGMTLYVFTQDKKNQSTCTGQCAQFWPPLLLTSDMQEPTNPAGSTGTFGVAPLAGGSMQLTYDGAPLYTFSKDKKPGDINGQGVGGAWWTAVAPGKFSTTDSTVSSLVKTATMQIMVTANGRTLYVFSSDKKNRSTCTGGCAKFWPPLLLVSGTTAPTTMPGISGVFSVAPLAGGAKQLAYQGAPLYTFANDKQAGDMKGQGVGGLWWIAAPAGQTSSATGEKAPTAMATAADSATVPATSVPPSSTPVPPASTVLPTSTASATIVPAAPTSTASATTVPPPPTATPVPMNTPQPTATVYIKPY